MNSIINSDILLSEWSGAAIEFSFIKKSPVIFIDTKSKINNLNWKKINLPCIEEDIRENIGEIVSLDKLENLPLIIKKLISQKQEWISKINEIEKKTVFNIGNSGDVGANIILKYINN